jgi:hypothetical protein
VYGGAYEFMALPVLVYSVSGSVSVTVSGFVYPNISTIVSESATISGSGTTALTKQWGLLNGISVSGSGSTGDWINVQYTNAVWFADGPQQLDVNDFNQRQATLNQERWCAAQGGLVTAAYRHYADYVWQGPYLNLTNYPTWEEAVANCIRIDDTYPGEYGSFGQGKYVYGLCYKPSEEPAQYYCEAWAYEVNFTASKWNGEFLGFTNYNHDIDFYGGVQKINCYGGVNITNFSFEGLSPAPSGTNVFILVNPMTGTRAFPATNTAVWGDLDFPPDSTSPPTPPDDESRQSVKGFLFLAPRALVKFDVSGGFKYQ